MPHFGLQLGPLGLYVLTECEIAERGPGNIKGREGYLLASSTQDRRNKFAKIGKEWEEKALNQGIPMTVSRAGWRKTVSVHIKKKSEYLYKCMHISLQYILYCNVPYI